MAQLKGKQWLVTEDRVNLQHSTRSSDPSTQHIKMAEIEDSNVSFEEDDYRVTYSNLHPTAFVYHDKH